MPTQRNVDSVEELKQAILTCTIAITADYSGMPVSQMSLLRRTLGAKGARLRVVKNTLAHLAADAAGRPVVKEIVRGPTAIAFGHGEPSEVAKAITDFIRVNRSRLSITGGALGERLLAPLEVEALATLPSKQELIGRLMGQLQAPVAGLARALRYPIAGLATVLQKRAESLAQ